MNIKGKKQVEALENVKDHKKRLVIINDYEDKLLHSWEQEIFKDIYNKRLHKIEGVTEKIDDNNLVFTALSTEKNPDFSKKDDPLTFLNKIRKGKITIEEAKESQKDFNNYLKKIRGGNKAQQQRKTLAILNMLFNGRNDAINFIEGYGSMILEAKKRTSEEQTKQDGTELKILTPKQMLQRLPIAQRVF